MLRKHRFAHFLAWALALGAARGLLADDSKVPFGNISWDHPATMGTKVPNSTYVPFQARRLAKDRFLWMNFDWLRKHHFDFPENGLTPEFEKQAGDALSYKVPGPNDPPTAYTSGEKTFFADRYGGDGMNNNWGSGRAGSAGMIQIKGIGRTPMVSVTADFYHATGEAGIAELMTEAVWGELNSELPYGAARMISINETGTPAAWDEEGEERAAEGAREDRVRVAAFVRRIEQQGDHIPENDWHFRGEQQRMEDAKNFLLNALPMPEGVDPAKLSPHDRYVAGTKELARRMGRQLGAAFPRGLVHGTTTASNYLMDGAWIDYGTQTYQPGFAHVRMMDEVAPAGEAELNQLVENLPDLAGAAPQSVFEGGALPTLEEYRKIARDAFQKQLLEEFLKLTGVPQEIVDKVKDKPFAVDLANSLNYMAQDSASDMVVEAEMPKQLTRFDVRSILTKLAATDFSPGAVKKVLANQMTGHGGELSKHAFQDEVANEYMEFMKQARKLAQDDGVSPAAFAVYTRENAEILNRKRWGLYHNNMNAEFSDVVEKYYKTGKRSLIQDAINKKVAENRLTHPGTGPYQVVLSAEEDSLHQTSLRHVFDARGNRDLLVLRAPVRGGQLAVNDIKVPLQGSDGVQLTLKDGSARAIEAKGVRDGEYLEFRWPVSKNWPARKNLTVVAHDQGRTETVSLRNPVQGRVKKAPRGIASCVADAISGR